MKKRSAKQTKWYLLPVGLLAVTSSLFGSRIQHWILSLPKPLQMVPFLIFVGVVFVAGMAYLLLVSDRPDA